MLWEIYHREREYARSVGDPRLGVVEADTQQRAEEIALERGLYTPGVGPLAVLATTTSADTSVGPRARR